MPRHNPFIPAPRIPAHYEFIIGNDSDAAYFSTIFHTTLGPGSRVQLNEQQYVEWYRRGVAVPAPVERETSSPEREFQEFQNFNYNVSIDQQALHQQVSHYQSPVQDWLNQNPDIARQAQDALNVEQQRAAEQQRIRVDDQFLSNILFGSSIWQDERPLRTRKVEVKHRATVSPLSLP